MRTKIAVSVMAALFCGSVAVASEFVCGTSAANDQRLRQLDAFVRARASRDRARGLAAPAPELRDSTIILSADTLNSPFRRPIDLAGESLEFTRESDGTYSSRVTDLRFDGDTGQSVTANARYTLTKFAFPFFDRTLTSVFLSSRIGIFPDSEPPSLDYQWSDLETAASRTPMIVPLWVDYAGFSPNTLRAKETTDALTVTWTAPGQYNIQAVLFRSGDVRFSYSSTDGLLLGITGITLGNEPVRDEKTSLVSITDPRGDVDPRVAPSLAPMIDIRSVDVRRIAGSNVLEVEVKVDAAIDQSVLSDTQALYYVLQFENAADAEYAEVFVRKSGITLNVPGWGTVDNTPALRVNGSSIIFDVLEEEFPTGTVDVLVLARQLSPGAGDYALATATVDPPSRPLFGDLRSTASSSASLLLTTYMLPIFNPAAAYNEVKSAWHLGDTDFDAVAFYQNFPTDLLLYAQAYATGGNSGTTGIKPNDSANATSPRAPTLLHMNAIGRGENSNDLAAAHAVLHEFAHRWLYYITIMENGKATHSLNPASAHPAQYVSTPAAFRVHTDKDASVMGGGFFTESGNGRFTSGPLGYFGNSWTDLYLMGLADASEVVPWYYIAHSSPALGGAYYPPANTTYSGTKTPVVVQQVIDAVGPRKPAYPETQRSFRVLFVLVAAPEQPAAESELAAMSNYRRLLETDFPVATGGRAFVSTFFADPNAGGQPRRRAVRH